MEDFQNCVVRHPYEPSLDRKDSSQSYTVSNTRLVCVAVNFGLNQWGDSVYFELARAAAEHGKVADLERLKSRLDPKTASQDRECGTVCSRTELTLIKCTLNMS